MYEKSMLIITVKCVLERKAIVTEHNKEKNLVFATVERTARLDLIKESNLNFIKLIKWMAPVCNVQHSILKMLLEDLELAVKTM